MAGVQKIIDLYAVKRVALKRHLEVVEKDFEY